jgi:hypothetical protein
MFENTMLREILGPIRNEVTGGSRRPHMRSFINCALRQVYMEYVREEDMGRHVAGMGITGTRIGYWWESQKESDYWEIQGVGGCIKLRRVLQR